MADPRECGFMGCGRSECVDFCQGLPHISGAHLTSVEEDTSEVKPYLGQVTYQQYVEDVELPSGWQRQYFEYLFPELEDGSRRVDDHTIMTKDAWLRMIEKIDEGVWAIDSSTVDGGSFSVSTEGYSRVQVTTPRQYGSSMPRFVLDEWHDHQKQRVDLTRLKDPHYISELQESIRKGLTDGQP